MPQLMSGVRLVRLPVFSDNLMAVSNNSLSRKNESSVPVRPSMKASVFSLHPTSLIALLLVVGTNPRLWSREIKVSLLMYLVPLQCGFGTDTPEVGADQPGYTNHLTTMRRSGWCLTTKSIQVRRSWSLEGCHSHTTSDGSVLIPVRFSAISLLD